MGALHSLAGMLLLAGGLVAQPLPVTFFEPEEISIPAGFTALISADLNGDGYSDLATVANGTTNGIDLVLTK